MPTLTVPNNWESLEWKYRGDYLDPNEVEMVELNGRRFKARAVERLGSYTDMGGPVTYVRSLDIQVEVPILDLPDRVWLSLYQIETLRLAVNRAILNRRVA